MKKHVILLLTLIFLVPNLALSNAVSVRVGYFIPRGQSDLWQTEFENMSFTKSNFQNTNLGFAYEYFLTREISFVLGLDSYSKNKVGFYKDYVGISFEEGDFAFPNDYKGDFSITHAFNVSITPIQASLKLTPLGRRQTLIPYVGGGAGLYVWGVRLQGNTIDFADIWVYEDPDLGDVEIYAVKPADLREENKFSIGYHVFGGLMYPIGSKLSIEAEFKYNFLKGNLKEAFLDFEPFDLSGYQISIGLNYWF